MKVGESGSSGNVESRREMALATHVVNVAGGNGVASEQSKGKSCWHMIAVTAILTTGCLATVAALVILSCSPQSPSNFLPQGVGSAGSGSYLPSGSKGDNEDGSGTPGNGGGGFGSLGIGGENLDDDDDDDDDDDIFGVGRGRGFDLPGAEFGGMGTNGDHDFSGFRNRFGHGGDGFAASGRGVWRSERLSSSDDESDSDYYEAPAVMPWSSPEAGKRDLPAVRPSQPGSASGQASGNLQGPDSGTDVISLKPGMNPPEKYAQYYFLPKYSMNVLMHGQSAQHGARTPLYDKAPDRTFCFVVAGTDSLGITGGGVNGAMARLILEQSPYSQLSSNDVRILTEIAHGSAVDAAKRKSGVLNESDVHGHPIYDRLFSFCERNIHPLPGVADTVSVAIIGLLKRAFYIYGHPNNRYLLYIVSPKGHAPASSFHVAYVSTWRNLILAVHKLNDQHTTLRVPKIEQIRLPLLSGGIYLGPGQTPEGLAREALKELLPLASMRQGGPLLDFMNDGNDSFFTAMMDVGTV